MNFLTAALLIGAASPPPWLVTVSVMVVCKPAVTGDVTNTLDTMRSGPSVTNLMAVLLVSCVSVTAFPPSALPNR